MQDQSGKIVYCDIEILLYEGNDHKKIIDEIVNKLEALGAPRGSHITIENLKEEHVPFGKKEGIAIYLDGINLPDSVYTQYDSNVVLSELSKLVGYNGEVQRYWQGNTEIALYFYGHSFEYMKNTAERQPFSTNCRIVQQNHRHRGGLFLLLKYWQ